MGEEGTRTQDAERRDRADNAYSPSPLPLRPPEPLVKPRPSSLKVSRPLSSVSPGSRVGPLWSSRRLARV